METVTKSAHCEAARQGWGPGCEGLIAFYVLGRRWRRVGQRGDAVTFCATHGEPHRKVG